MLQTEPSLSLLLFMLVDSSNKPVASSELIGTAVVAPLRPSELEIAWNYCPKRLAEFSCGRACAHEALGMLNRDVHAILPGSRGEPLWPKGVVGSITHCEGYAGAIVALRKGCRSVGIDAEPNVTIGADLFPYVMRGEEMEQVAALSRQNRNICWDKLVFSAKEVVYKTWYPLYRTWLDFSQATICFQPEVHTLNLSNSPISYGEFIARLDVDEERSIYHGTWLLSHVHNLLLTGIIIQ